jgi:hypothetical protein
LTCGQIGLLWRLGTAQRQDGAWMRDKIWRRSDWPTVGVCLVLSGFGLAAVPFIGTKYGDWPEAMALAIGLLPLVYVSIYFGTRIASRLADIDRRLSALEASRAGHVKPHSTSASITAISASDRPK